MYRIKLKDRTQEVENLRSMLGMLGFRLEYNSVDLIHKSLIELNRKGASLTIKDIDNVRVANEEKWDKYFKENPQE